MTTAASNVERWGATQERGDDASSPVANKERGSISSSPVSNAEREEHNNKDGGSVSAGGTLNETTSIAVSSSPVSNAEREEY